MDYPIHFAEQLSQHLKSFRKSRHLTQEHLAELLGIAQSRVADIEMHPGKVSLENLFKVFVALDIQLVLRDVAKSQALNSATPQPEKKTESLAARKAQQERPPLDADDW